MKVFDNHIVMSKEELDAKIKNQGKKTFPFGKDDICFSNGKWYVSNVDDNRFIPPYATWMEVVICK